MKCLNEKEKKFICACRGADDSFPALRLQSKREGRNFSGKSAKRRGACHNESILP